MQVVLKINDRGNVRDALPIRAIPYVTSWNESPDKLVRTLAAPKTTRVGSLEIRNRYNELFAYQMDAQGEFEQVWPEQWEDLVVTLDSLTRTSRARECAEQANHASWRIKAVLKLPDNVFVWLDEFQAWYSSTRPLTGLAPEHDGDWKTESDSLCLVPILPPTLESRLWRYAEDLPLAAVEQAPPAVKIEIKETAAAKVEAVADTSPSGDNVEEQALAPDVHDETLAALFDPVPVATLETMFPTHTEPSMGKWKSWADRAARNDLNAAREGRGLFNPYKAGVWFLGQGINRWDIARLNRTLAKNLPARSRGDAHLLTGGID